MVAPTLIDQLADAGPNHSPELWNGKEGLRVAPDGLPAREVSQHNRDKAHYIRGYSDIFSKAMSKKWGSRCYLDLFCGPGVCWVKDTGRFVLGSPLIALNVDEPITHVVFNDLDEDCTDALEARMAETDAQRLVLNRNANDTDLLDRIRAFIPRNALSLALLDPQGHDLDLETIRYLSNDRKMDLLINFPVHNFWRCLCANDTLVLDRALGKGWPARTTTRPWRTEVREHFNLQLAEMGYTHREAKQVWNTKNSPMYDFILYSEHELAIKFFRSAIRTDGSGNEPFPMFAV